METWEAPNCRVTFWQRNMYHNDVFGSSIYCSSKLPLQFIHLSYGYRVWLRIKKQIIKVCESILRFQRTDIFVIILLIRLICSISSEKVKTMFSAIAFSPMQLAMEFFFRSEGDKVQVSAACAAAIDAATVL